MASPLLSLPLSGCLFRLPPSIRASVYQHGGIGSRFFSATARNSSIADALVAGPTAVLDGIHALGVPWYAAIPLSAVLVRGTMGYYIAARPSRKRQITRRNLFPLIELHARVKSDGVSKMDQQLLAHRGRDSVSWLMRLARFVEVQRNRILMTHQIGKTFQAPLVSWRTFFNFATLLAFAEAIRVKCGAREGLLPAVTDPVDRVISRMTGNSPATSAPAAPSEVLPPGEALAQRLEVAREAQQAKHAAASESGGSATPFEYASGEALAPSYDVQLPLQQQSPTPAYADFLDPSLQMEGLPWCQDLTLHDPTLILPLALLVTSAASILLRRPRATPTATPPPPPPPPPPPQSPSVSSQQQSPIPIRPSAPPKTDVDAALAAVDALNQTNKKRQIGVAAPFANLAFGQRLGLTFSMLFFFIALQMPAGMLLYILPALVTGWVQGRWLDVRYPLPDPILPCRRPMRIKVRRHF